MIVGALSVSVAAGMSEAAQTQVARRVYRKPEKQTSREEMRKIEAKKREAPSDVGRRNGAGARG